MDLNFPLKQRGHCQHFVANKQNQQHIFTRVHLEAAEAVAAIVVEAGGATTGATESGEVLLLLLLLPGLLPLPPPADVAFKFPAITTLGFKAVEAEVALFRLAFEEEPLLLLFPPPPPPPFLITVSAAEAWPPDLPDRWDDDLVSLAIKDGLPKLHSALFCSPPKKKKKVL